MEKIGAWSKFLALPAPPLLGVPAVPPEARCRIRIVRSKGPRQDPGNGGEGALRYARQGAPGHRSIDSSLDGSPDAEPGAHRTEDGVDELEVCVL